MSKLLKRAKVLSLITLLSSGVLFASDAVESKEIEAKKTEVKKVETKQEIQSEMDIKALAFERKKIPTHRFDINSIDIVKSVKLDNVDGWYAYVFQLNLTMKQNKKQIDTLDFLFTNGEVIAPDLLDMKTKRSIKDTLIELPESYYDDAHFIGGTKGAKNKLVIFSDPLCPFCLDFVPDMIKFVEKHKEQFALYYYHFPILAIHPAAETIIKASIVAEHQKVKNVTNRIYTNNDKFPNSKESNKTKILNGVNEILGTKITLADIEAKEIVEAYQGDIMKAQKVMVMGTPTLFVNGKKDSSKSKHESLVK